MDKDDKKIIEEQLGMIWYLAELVAGDGRFEGIKSPTDIVNEAHENYQEGLNSIPRPKFVARFGETELRGEMISTLFSTVRAKIPGFDDEVIIDTDIWDITIIG